ncbi:glycosyltransferase family 4 protein [Fomitiporia mediterranea MF3/22]|uniref:glycosyltransferase family 4 protein n=1 Tax=Fomitiporia mediterranea (strain MF3/22) TaxID=694068 RepID=UPI0004408848|nr:glycosyltransferase family 4 protein [Fomitiporia mediterranea MF3/22]EJC98471.1 glycosyltransferase family 4 protein [Fomitiporia mediterranea MF3/22]
MAIWYWLLLPLSLVLAPLLLAQALLAKANVINRRKVLRELGIPDAKHKHHTLVGFFHPYCNAGGGGERVLWTAIALLQRKDPHIISVVYSGDGAAGKEEIIAKVKTRFNITLDPSKLHFVFFSNRYLVEDSTWPRFTLLGQSLGSIPLVLYAFKQLIPDLYIDTMGYAFTYPFVRLLSAGKVPVGAYVHYPTISTDMLARAGANRFTFSNIQNLTLSDARIVPKLLYYRAFMACYATALRCASFLMANSTWTKNHVDSLLVNHAFGLLCDDPLLGLDCPSDALSLSFWTQRKWKTHVPPRSAHIVYPPCETQELVDFPLEGRRKVIVSVAQFRPEKDHAAQLRALAKLFESHPEHRRDARLIMIGGCRNADDEARVNGLRALSKELGVSENVEFVLNAPHPEVLSWLSRASVGLSTMVDEHFGINVVEFMAAGVIPVVHASAGPFIDIVVPYKGEPTGYHATTPQTFATQLHSTLSLSPAEEHAMRLRARTWAVERFSRAGFERAWEESGWRKWLPASYSPSS